MFLSPIHNFRALAIIFIVAGHTIWAFQWDQHPHTRDFLADFFENGTVLFVFISGFLFRHLSGRFRYADFLKKKFLNVVLPYLIISVPAILYAVLRQNPAEHFPQLHDTSILYEVFWFYLKGGATINYPLWFIPMITVYFICSPAFILLTRHPNLYASLVVLVPVSLLAHRPEFPNLNLVHLSVYYLSAYVCGMFCCEYRQKIEPIVSRWALWLTAGFALMLLAHFHFSRFHGNYEVHHIFSTEKGLIDWMYLQKLYLCFALWGVMVRCDTLLGPRIHFLADISFSIFFVHMYIIFGIKIIEHWRPIEGSALAWSVEVAAVMLVCALFAWSTRKLLGSRSRMVIGS